MKQNGSMDAKPSINDMRWCSVSHFLISSYGKVYFLYHKMTLFMSESSHTYGQNTPLYRSSYFTYPLSNLITLYTPYISYISNMQHNQIILILVPSVNSLQIHSTSLVRLSVTFKMGILSSRVDASIREAIRRRTSMITRSASRTVEPREFLIFIGDS
jgi:hypothetical protein